ncbi:hypothetical protein H072_6312 [Dactylellina haptotyla CBS 200.50]|uniref:Protein kinase domain-containing protein n=1 Tax=Dactylellina haptotyla (strain CBS 200.50) TaxID=1284197 RepID=S8AAK6_DACHA|nr:hypothetical protein H072_6312 [Dactylellina haptotyla CBS 200.50]
MTTFSGTTSFFARRKFASDSSSASLASRSSSVANQTEHGLLSFLATAQSNEVDFLPMSWQPEMGGIGGGGTSNIQQSFMNLNLSYAFKRIHRGVDEPYAYRALVSEVSILGHKDIRRHPNIVKLVGICWDVMSSIDPIWPVLVFPKSDLGDLRQFMKSTIGEKMDFDGRMKLCDNAAVGLIALHSLDVVHGDIKPQNVLVFIEETNGTSTYVAKVGDFGYSTLVGGEGMEGEGEAQVPVSRPWNAPEVTSWSSSFGVREAKLTDIFSFGLMTLWLLFNKQLFELEVDFEKLDPDPSWKQSENMQRIFSKVVDDLEGFDTNQKSGLKDFFTATLSIDPANRQLELKPLMEKFTAVAPAKYAMNTYLAWIPYLQYVPHNKNFDVKAFQKSYYDAWSGYSNPYDAYNPYHPTNLHQRGINPTTGFSLGRSGASNYRPSDFLIWKSFHQLVEGDHRIWTLIFTALKDQVEEQNIPDEEKQSAAFQLAFCYETGFGTLPDASEVDRYLEIACKTRQDLLHITNLIRDDKNPMQSKNVDTNVSTSIEPSQFDDIEEVEEIYTAASDAALRLFGEDHTVSIHLKNIKAMVYRRKGAVGKAMEIYQRLLEVCTEYYGVKHPYTLQMSRAIADIHRSTGNLELAVKLEQESMELDTMFDANNLQSKVGGIQKLATTYRKQKRWEEAEQLELRILEINTTTMGEAHIQTLLVMSKLVTNYLKQNLVLKAEEMAIDLNQKALARYGEEHDYTLDSMSLLCKVNKASKKWESVLSMASKVIDIKTKRFGPNDEKVQVDRVAVVDACIGLKDTAKAIDMQYEVVRCNKIVLGPKSLSTLSDMEMLGILLFKEKRYREAAEIEAEIVARREESQGAEHQDTLLSAYRLKNYKQLDEEAKV